MPRSVLRQSELRSTSFQLPETGFRSIGSLFDCSYRSSRIGQHHHADHANDTLDNVGD
jgi:hypothetical protein